MDEVVLQMFYDGTWSVLPNGRKEYKNGKNRLFLVQKGCTFDQLLARVYEVLQIDPNEYSITMKTKVKSSVPDLACSQPTDITDDETVRIILHMGSNFASYGCVPVFITKSHKAPNEDPVIVETYNNSSKARVSADSPSEAHSNSPIDDWYDGDDDVQVDAPISDSEALPQVQDKHEPRQSQPVTRSARSNKKIINFCHFPTLAPSRPPNLSGPDFTDPRDNRFSSGKMFKGKDKLILELRKVSLRHKFDFKIARSTKVRFEAHCRFSSCKWRLRATKISDREDALWMVRRCDNKHTCADEVLRNGLRSPGSRFLGHLIAEKILQKQICSPNEIRESMQQENTVNLSYQQAYRSRKAALEMTGGSSATEVSSPNTNVSDGK